MAHFFLKLVPPRPTFVQDITPAETAAMVQHAAYWQGVIERGTRVFALGLVLDPTAAFGVAIIEVESEAEARALTDDDPAIQANCGLYYKIYPMPRGVMRSS